MIVYASCDISSFDLHLHEPLEASILIDRVLDDLEGWLVDGGASEGCCLESVSEHVEDLPLRNHHQ